MILIARFFWEQVIFLTSLVLILASSTLINHYDRKNVAESRQSSQIVSPKYKYYSNKKGTQVIEIGPGNVCQIFQGQDAAWLHETKGENVKAVNYFQFRLMVGKCQLDAFLNNRAPYAPYQKIDNNPHQVQGVNNKTNHNITREQEGLTPSSHNLQPESNLPVSSVKNETKGNDPDVTDPSKLPLIFPGTKWCGAGSSAKNNDDLGIYVETDKCCRAHDLCEDNMEGKECKHGLCNDSEFTRSHCECDEQFRTCLQRDKSLSSLASFKIANLYFNILKPLCFAERPPVKWCRRHRITGECIDFEFEPGYRSEWQFFPAQPYLTQAVEKFINPALPPIPLFRPPPPSPSPPDTDEGNEEEEGEDEDKKRSLG